jgi:hypothetical protein
MRLFRSSNGLSLRCGCGKRQQGNSEYQNASMFRHQ